MSDGTLLPDEPHNRGKDRLVGNYHLQRLIGSGAMGEVYLAHHSKFAGREYAIKLIRPEVTSDEAQRRFEREILAMSGLVHPNLVFATDAGVDRGRHYLVMEYVRGRDLQHLIDEHGAFRATQAAEIVSQICAGVSHAHQHGVVHRDIKPANVLLGDDRVVKVLDLGIASLQSETASRMTRGHNVMGTAAFIAPELWDNALSASPASDVYAIGCTAYSLFTGAPPFAGEAHHSIVQLMNAHKQSDPVPLHELRSDIPEELAFAILRAVSKNPDRRFQDAGELAEQIAPYCEPLSEVSEVFDGNNDTARLRTTTVNLAKSNTTHHDGDSPLNLLAWIVASAMIILAGVSLAMTYLWSDVASGWSFVFGRLGKLSNPESLGFVDRWDSRRNCYTSGMLCTRHVVSCRLATDDQIAGFSAAQLDHSHLSNRRCGFAHSRLRTSILVGRPSRDECQRNGGFSRIGNDGGDRANVGAIVPGIRDGHAVVIAADDAGVSDHDLPV